MSVGGSGSLNLVFVQQADAAISQVNPVSATLYPVLPTTRNVRLIGIGLGITWAVTQPTPLEVIVTIDGQTWIFTKDNPVSGTWYVPWICPYNAEAGQVLDTAVGNQVDNPKAFLMEGKSVRVQVRVTWAVTQPTPLICRVKYAKIP